MLKDAGKSGILKAYFMKLLAITSQLPCSDICRADMDTIFYVIV